MTGQQYKDLLKAIEKTKSRYAVKILQEVERIGINTRNAGNRSAVMQMAKVDYELVLGMLQKRAK